MGVRRKGDNDGGWETIGILLYKRVRKFEQIRKIWVRIYRIRIKNKYFRIIIKLKNIRIWIKIQTLEY